MSRESVGEFEQLVLLAILRLDEEAYGVSILEEMRSHGGRRILRPAVYVSLGRLEEKGLVRSREESAAGRGGRPRKYYEVTPEGIALLSESRETLLSMWSGIEPLLDDG